MPKNITKKEQSNIRENRSTERLVTRTLLVLLELGHIFEELSFSGTSLRGFRWQARRDYYMEKRYLQQILWRLERQGYITRNGQGVSAEIQLTEAGQRHIRRVLADRLEGPRRLPWDGNWHVISFDVPEHHRVGRNLLRRKLQQLGCYQLQRSVFVYPYDISDIVEKIRNAYDLRTDVIYLVVSKFTNAKKFVTLFKNRGVLL